VIAIIKGYYELIGNSIGFNDKIKIGMADYLNAKYAIY